MLRNRLPSLVIITPSFAAHSLRFASASSNSQEQQLKTPAASTQNNQSSPQEENLSSESSPELPSTYNNVESSSNTPSPTNTNKSRRSTNKKTSSSSSSASSFVSAIPPGWEVYLSCVGIIAGWWYWNEASYRRVDRQCETLETQARERTKQLGEVVKKTESTWHDDVKSKEALLNKVQQENLRLAKLLDDVSNYLKKCDIPLEKQT